MKLDLLVADESTQTRYAKYEYRLWNLVLLTCLVTFSTVLHKTFYLFVSGVDSCTSTLSVILFQSHKWSHLPQKRAVVLRFISWWFIYILKKTFYRQINLVSSVITSTDNLISLRCSLQMWRLFKIQTGRLN